MSEKKKISFSPPDITDEEIAEVVEALRSGWITMGIKVMRPVQYQLSLGLAV